MVKHSWQGALGHVQARCASWSPAQVHSQPGQVAAAYLGGVLDLRRRLRNRSGTRSAVSSHVHIDTAGGSAVIVLPLVHPHWQMQPAYISTYLGGVLERRRYLSSWGDNAQTPR